MKATSIFVSAIFVLLFAACTSTAEPEVDPTPIAQATSAATSESEPAPTASPTATNTATPLPTPTPLPSPTAVPSPTPQICDLPRLTSAYAQLDTFDSLKNLLDVKAFEPQGTKVLSSFQTTMALARRNGQINSLEFSRQSTGFGEPDIDFIMMQNRFYYRQFPDLNWRLLEGELGASLLDSATDSAFLTPNFVEILAGGECTVTSTDLAGQPAQLYQFSSVIVADMPSVIAVLAEVEDTEVGSANIDIWLVSIEGQDIPIKVLLEYGVASEGEEIDMSISQLIYDVNVPIRIEIPNEVAAPRFFIEIPLPDDAQVSLEGENILVFITTAPPEKMLALYMTWLEDTGWTQISTSIAEQEGIAFKIVEYARDEQEIAVAVGESNGYSIVSMAGADNL